MCLLRIIYYCHYFFQSFPSNRSCVKKFFIKVLVHRCKLWKFVYYFVVNVKNSFAQPKIKVLYIFSNKDTSRQISQYVLYGLSILHKFSKSWTQVLCWFKSCAWRVKDLQWWKSLTIVPVGNKAKRVLSVNNSEKTIHHH